MPTFGFLEPPFDTRGLLKSRAAPRSVIGGAVPAFQRVFAEFIAELRRPGTFESMLQDRRLIPSVPVTICVLHGCRLALAREQAFACWNVGRGDAE